MTQTGNCIKTGLIFISAVEGINNYLQILSKVLERRCKNKSGIIFRPTIIIIILFLLKSLFIWDCVFDGDDDELASVQPHQQVAGQLGLVVQHYTHTADGLQ